MPVAQSATTVNASPERVFELFTDLAHAPERVRGIKRLELSTPAPVRKGTRFRETRVMFGREATMEMEIVAFEPGKSYTVGCESCGARYLTRFDFKGEGAGTRVAVRFEVTALSVFAKLMSPFAGMMIKACAKACEQDLADLKQVAEGGADKAALAR